MICIYSRNEILFKKIFLSLSRVPPVPCKCYFGVDPCVLSVQCSQRRGVPLRVSSSLMNLMHWHQTEVEVETRAGSWTGEVTA